MSVEQKIREVLEYFAIEQKRLKPNISTNQATQSILQIIESDVIGENKLSVSKPLSMPESIYNYLKGKDDLRDLQRANLREDKS